MGGDTPYRETRERHEGQLKPPLRELGNGEGNASCGGADKPRRFDGEADAIRASRQRLKRNAELGPRRKQDAGKQPKDRPEPDQVAADCRQMHYSQVRIGS
jgi:hypothetical protein